MAMKIRTTIRHLREGLKNVYRNGWMSVASIGAVTITLILVSAFLALLLNLNQIANKIEEDVEIKVLIDRTADEEEIKILGQELEKLDQIDKMLFASKDDELHNLVESMGEEGKSWLLFEQDNPLHHAYIVKSKNPSDTQELAEIIAELPYVEEVNFGEDVVERLFQFNQYARNIGLVLVIGLILTAMFLISNTIKLTIMSRSTEIGIMKLVGATNGFIRGPFFIEGMFLGFLGTLLPITGILTGYYYLETNIKDKISFSFIDLLPFNPFAWQLSLVILAIGTLIGMWGSVMSIRKFLKV